MITVSKAELKAKMLEYFRTVEQTGEELIVTSNREPVLKVVRLNKNKTPSDVFRGLQGKVSYHGNILDDTSNEWDER